MPALDSGWRLSPATYYFDFVAVPAFAGFALWCAEFAVYTASGFILGFLAWTLAEYLIHRFVFHGRDPFWAEHLIHHRLPADHFGVPPWQTVLLMIVLWALAWFCLGERLGSATFAGLALGYFTYIVFHHVHHHHARYGRYLRFIGHLHDIHHARHRVNFGVSSPLWDVIFATYQPH